MAALRESLRVSPVVAFVVPTSNWRGGVRGDENLWPVDKWLELVNTFSIIGVLGQAHYNLPGRLLGYIVRRFFSRRMGLAARLSRDVLIRLKPCELFITVQKKP